MSKAALRAPRGTRDYYPAEMAVRLHIESAWREASICNGFEEIEGPNFEHLDLYTLKSGQGIVSELFSFRREGGDDTYALRPEFTPTIARMVVRRRLCRWTTSFFTGCRLWVLGRLVPYISREFLFPN